MTNRNKRNQKANEDLIKAGGKARIESCGSDGSEVIQSRPETSLPSDSNKTRQDVVNRILALQRQFAGRGIDVDALIDEQRQDQESD